MRIIDLYTENNPVIISGKSIDRMKLKHPHLAGAIDNLIKKGIVERED